jgi:hypothetical protein
MSDWPAIILIPGPLVVASTYSAGGMGGAFGGTIGLGSSGAFIAANRAMYQPFRLTRSFLVQVLGILNGGTVSGNIDVGIYDVAGTRLVSSGSTPQAGTSAVQSFNVTDTWIGPGLFYHAVAMDNATGQLSRVGPTTNVNIALGLAQEASAFPLPANATFAQVSANPVLYIHAAANRAFI